LFINADREFTAGRAQNYLNPQHVEKIVAAYHDYQDIPSFARVVDVTELAENDFNLNIRRYVDNTPPPEPQDVRAHLHGGVPLAEIEAHAPRFQAYGIDVMTLFAPADRPGYLAFPAQGWQQVADEIPAFAEAKKAELDEAFGDWWDRHVKHIVELPVLGPGRVMDTRRDLLESFVSALEPLGTLDQYQLAGVIASWWGDVQYDIRTLAYNKFSGVVQGWLTTIEAIFEADGEDDVRDKQRQAAEKRRAREHSAVPLLIPDYLTALEEAEARRADLDAHVKAATAKPDEDDEADDDVSAETLSPEALKKLRADLADAKRKVKRLEAEFLERLKISVAKLDAESEEALVRHILKADLTKRLAAAFAVGPRALSDRYRLWATKYAVDLRALETSRDEAAAKLNLYLKELGYE
jgi:type I restriction enzyme M protein